MWRHFHLPTYTFTVTIFLIHHHKTPIRSAIRRTCFAKEIPVFAPSARSDTVSYLSSLMFLFGTCARYPEGNETKSGRVFRASWDHVEDGILTRAVLDSGPGYYLLLRGFIAVMRCFFFVFSLPTAPLWRAQCPQPERLSLIKQAFQSRCHGYLERETPGQRPAIGNLSIL